MEEPFAKSQKPPLTPNIFWPSPPATWSRRNYLIFILLNLLPIGLVWLWPLNWWLKMNRFETGSLLSAIAFCSAILPMAFAGPWAIAALIYLFKRQSVSACIFMLMSAAAWVVAFNAARDTVYQVRFTRLIQAGIEAKPLIAAIQKHEAETGAPPKRLRHLVPTYINIIPQTGIPVYPDFTYRDSSFTPPNKWELSIPCGMGLGFDQFLYLPEGNYPAEGYGGVLKRVGNWAYVFE